MHTFLELSQDPCEFEASHISILFAEIEIGES